MRSVALRDFQQKGSRALSGQKDEPILLTTRSGPSYFLVPAETENLEIQSLELERAMALSSLRRWQLRAKELGLDQMTEDEIHQEVQEARKNKKAAK